MKYLPILLAFTIIVACNSKADSDIELNGECELVYISLTKDNNKYCDYLQQEIDEKLKDNSNIIIQKYDSLTRNYITYLDKVCNKINKNTSIIFFNKEGYSEEGQEYIDITNKYKKSVEELASESLKKRLNLILNTNDRKHVKGGIADNNEYNSREKGHIYCKYLDYYYKGLPNSQSIASLTLIKKCVLDMEMEYILNNL